MSRREDQAVTDDEDELDEDACPYCGEPFDGWETHYGLDVRVGEGKAYVVFQACCEEMQQDVELSGYDAAYGRRLVDVVQEITGHEVLHVEDDGDGSVVCRLRVKDPVRVGPRDALGRASAASPPGWRTEVFADVEKHHRHHEAPVGHKFSLAVYNGSVKVGVAVVGRPVSRELQSQEPRTLEVTRVTTWGEAPLRANASSKLYGAAAARAKELGYTKLVTYTLADIESGASLVASGWVETHRGDRVGGWGRASRPREDKAPVTPKVRWERGLTKATQREVAERARLHRFRRLADRVIAAVMAAPPPGVSAAYVRRVLRSQRDEIAATIASWKLEAVTSSKVVEVT